jgi:hypothetical protein
MHKLIAGLLAATIATAAYATCVSHTYFVNGRVVICSTCCYGTNCSTVCTQ